MFRDFPYLINVFNNKLIVAVRAKVVCLKPICSAHFTDTLDSITI